jgi:NAD(P)-dependent dehydrogenase (short-subunit alcohol dehydrogenase family)
VHETARAVQAERGSATAVQMDAGAEADVQGLVATALSSHGRLDVAFNNADDDFARIEGVPIVRAWREKTGHGGSYREPNGGSYGKVAVAWLRWRLMSDAEAGKLFTGNPCGLCADPAWHVRRKGLD